MSRRQLPPQLRSSGEQAMIGYARTTARPIRLRLPSIVRDARLPISCVRKGAGLVVACIHRRTHNRLHPDWLGAWTA